jgi:hypothetical protein
MIPLENYRYVKEYDQTATVSDELIQSLILYHKNNRYILIIRDIL